MRLPWHFAVCVTCLALVYPSRAETPDVLRLIPEQADVLVKIEQPRKLLEAILNSPVVKDLYQIDAVHDLYNSTNARRFHQLVAYFEKQLGMDRLEMLDHLAGGGAALAVKFEPMPTPVWFAVQARDEQALRRFFQLGLDILEQELARQEAKDRPEKSTYRGIETVAVGKELHVALVGSAVVASNGADGLHRAIDQHLDGGKKSLARVAHVSAARQLAGPGSLLWAWLNLETVRQTPGGKEVFSGKNPALTVLAGPVVDIVRRSPFLCAGVAPCEHGFALSFRMPRGREGMPAELAALLPSAGAPGSRPLLKPQGVLYSTSYFMNLAELWEKRATFLTPEQLKKVEEVDKKSGLFLAGTPVSTLLTGAGPYQRIVVAHQSDRGYKTKPGQYVPAFAFILEMREPESFRKRVETILRGAALVATTQVPLTLVEETHGEHKIIGYRFLEDGKFKGDVNGIRFNFSPCFVAVGNQLAVCSTLELCHELTDLLEKEAAHPGPIASPADQTRIYASGATALLDAFKDRLFTQTILERALPPDRAREQVRAFTDWVRRLGVLQIEGDYGRQDFHYDIQLRLGDAD